MVARGEDDQGHEAGREDSESRCHFNRPPGLAALIPGGGKKLARTRRGGGLHFDCHVRSCSRNLQVGLSNVTSYLRWPPGSTCRAARCIGLTAISSSSAMDSHECGNGAGVRYIRWPLQKRVRKLREIRSNTGSPSPTEHCPLPSRINVELFRDIEVLDVTVTLGGRAGDLAFHAAKVSTSFSVTFFHRNCGAPIQERSGCSRAAGRSFRALSLQELARNSTSRSCLCRRQRCALYRS
jgi:hypothetical protein